MYAKKQQNKTHRKKFRISLYFGLKTHKSNKMKHGLKLTVTPTSPCAPFSPGQPQKTKLVLRCIQFQRHKFKERNKKFADHVSS